MGRRNGEAGKMGEVIGGSLPRETAGRALALGRQSLARRLLLVAASFVVLTEALVFVPSLAQFRHTWLVERFDTGELAVLAARVPAGGGFARSDHTELLRAAQIARVALIAGESRTPLVGQAQAKGAQTIDLESQTLGAQMFGVFDTAFAPKDRSLAIIGRPRASAAVKWEVIVAEAPLRQAMLMETGRVASYSLVLALTIALLIYAALTDSFVRPMQRLTTAITRFRAAPDDGSFDFQPSTRADEIGQAERAFGEMQDTVRQAFFQRERLAQLGLSVSKIAHDLRHSLGAAQLVSERLAGVDDPVVRATAPRLERALERAIGLAQSTLRFGKAEEAAPRLEWINLVPALDEAAQEALNGLTGVEWVCRVPADTAIEADADHLHRVLTNLLRNAGQALVAQGAGGKVTAQMAGQTLGEGICPVLQIADTGPGLPQKVVDSLFQPFSGSGLSGGTGLGLAIARDLMRLNGGDIELVSTGAGGTCFALMFRAGRKAL
ncbi:MAG: hypothetical protein RL186_468 [Pseudomonadota bacterium]